MDVQQSSHSSDNIHLLVLIHGLWGSPKHLQVAQEEVVRVHANYAKSRSDASRLHVIVPTANRGTLTYDGMDVCASRVLVEVKQEIYRIESAGGKVREFSVMGYSLGGLVARYFVGLLLASDRSFFCRHRPVSFSTLATPHLGILKYKNHFWQWVAVKYGHRLLGRSGDQLYYWDRFDDEEGDIDEQGRKRDRRPLLEVMADPSGLFIKAINRFERISIFANAVQDATVPYPTGAIDKDDHFVYNPADKGTDDVIIETDTDHLITRWYTVPQAQADDCPPPTYRELFDTDRKIPVSVPINAAHENFVVRIEPVDAHETIWSESKTPSWTPYNNRELPSVAPHAKCASFKLDNRQFAVSMMRIIIANKAKRASHSILPPFLRFKRPYNWLFYASMPVLMPMFMVLVVAVFHHDSFASRRRVGLLGQVKSALLSGLNSASQSSALRVLAVAELTRLISSAEMNVGSTGANLLSATGEIFGLNMGEEEMEVTEEQNIEQSLISDERSEQGSSRSHGTSSSIDKIDAALDCSSFGSSSGTSTRRGSLVDAKFADYGICAVASAVEEAKTATIKDTKLQMTTTQLRVAEMLNRGLDQAKTTKYLTWFPDVPNAHAAIVVRDGPLFPEQEIGRGVLRRWADLTIAN